MRITLHLQPATRPSPPGRGAPTRYRKKLPQTKIELSSHSFALTPLKTYMEPWKLNPAKWDSFFWKRSFSASRGEKLRGVRKGKKGEEWKHLLFSFVGGGQISFLVDGRYPNLHQTASNSKSLTPAHPIFVEPYYNVLNHVTSIL